MALYRFYQGAAGLCIGYSFCHVFLQYLVLRLVFEPLEIELGERWGTEIEPDQLLLILILGIVLRMISRNDERLFQAFTFVGMGLWLAVGVLMQG